MAILSHRFQQSTILYFLHHSDYVSVIKDWLWRNQLCVNGQKAPKNNDLKRVWKTWRVEMYTLITTEIFRNKYANKKPLLLPGQGV